MTGPDSLITVNDLPSSKALQMSKSPPVNLFIQETLGKSSYMRGMEIGQKGQRRMFYTETFFIATI